MNERARRDEDILEERARKLARRRQAPDESPVVADVMLATVGGETLGLPRLRLREVVPYPPVSLVPRLPPALRGVTQIRGELVSVVDLAVLLGRERGPAPRLLALVEGATGLVGVGIDAVIGFREVRASELAHALGSAAPEDGTAPRALVASVTRDFVALLDVDALFLDPRIRTSGAHRP